MHSFIERDAGGVSIIALLGEHDVTTAPELDQRLEALQAGGGGVAVDLGGASFVDSAIIGTLLNAWRRAERQDSGFAVAVGDAAGIVHQALAVTGLLDTLRVCDSRDAAIAAASEAPV